MKEKLGIGIVGLGNIAPVHAQAIQQAYNAELISCYSSREEKAKSFSEKYGIKSFTEWNKFINDDELDIVSICTPNGTHLDFGKKTATAGKHVVIEKPIEVNLERANKLIKSCKDNDVKLAVIYQNRFLPAVEKLKQMITENKLGKIFMADAYVKWYRSDEYYKSAEWRATLKLDGGGVLINQAIHTVDLLYWFIGDVESIYAVKGTITHEGIEGEDNAVTLVKYKNGAMGVIVASTSVQPAMPRRIEIHGENGTAVLNDDNLEVSLIDESIPGKSPGEEDKTHSGAADPLAGFSIEPHKKQFEQIVNAILNGEEPVVSGEESLKSLGIVNAVYESAEKKKPVDFDMFMKVKLK
ncbi:MAG: Gfo/Idh/MocA family oxidoreductase [Ignavibacteria bacterium]|jgi:predicted dehydrogenase